MNNNKKSAVIVLAVFVILIAGGVIGYNVLSQNYNEQANEEEADVKTTEDAEAEPEDRAQAADFTVYNKAGDEVKLSDYQGKKPVVVNFWASWCPPCKEEMPFFQTAADEYGEEVEILMIDLTDGSRETIEKADEFIKTNGYTMNVLYDTDMDASRVYYIQSIPRTIFIDIEGKISYNHVGMITQEQLDSNIEKLL